MIALALAAALAATPAAALDETDEAPPLVEAGADPAPLLACLAAADRDPEAERRCIGVQSGACLDGLGAAAEAPALAACAAAEAAGWDAAVGTLAEGILGLMRFQTGTEADAQAEAGAEGVPEADLLVAAQAAWVAFRDADCAQEAAHWGEDPMREAALAECRLDRNAGRALELLGKRRMWENP